MSSSAKLKARPSRPTSLRPSLDKGPPLPKHPYVEVAFILEGCATITVGNEQREVKAGGIVVIPANTPHRFVNSGDTVLHQIDIHASPRFIQTNLT